MSKYLPTIGIETHVQLKTKTKLFSGVGNDASQAPPNTLISHIDVALPGALPVLNAKALELAARAAFALNTKPQTNSYFERKHYFYPDSPAGYQISQLHAPIIIGGSVTIGADDQRKTININRAQLEADAGKNTHPAGADYSLVDLNRAGTPLLEIVSEAEIHGAAEAKAYVRELYLLMKYAGVSDCDLYLGHMRFDVNVSLSADEGKLGTRAEIKNLNSFRSVEGAVAYEIGRQSELLENGEEVIQETRGWDEDSQKTLSQRGKEEAQDYRYMPEPDIPPLQLSEAEIAGFGEDLPLLPDAIRAQLSKLDIDLTTVEDVLDQPPENVQAILGIIKNADPVAAKRAVFWSLESGHIDPERDTALSRMIDEGRVSTSAAKTIREEMAKGSDAPEAVAERLNLIQVSDEGEIDKIVSDILAANAKAAEDVKNGELKAIGFLVGQVMAKSGGKANPGLAQQIIKKQLGI